MSLVSPAKPKAYHRKVHGGHHSRSKHYLKPYWPYIPMVLIVLSGFMFNSILISSSEVLGESQDFSSTSLLSDTNKDRQLDHEGTLSVNENLANAAQAKAEDMVNNNYWSHTSPSGATPWSFISNSGYQYQSAGENLAYGFNSSAAVEKAWMNSPEHKANILDGSYKDVGFGVAEAANYLGQGPKVVVVAEYGQPTGVLGATSPAVLSDSNQSQLVSRLQLITSPTAFWLSLLASALVGAGAVFIIYRHAFYFKDLFEKGEGFIIHHPMLDLFVVLVMTYSIVLTRSAGFIT
jgi:hypothetical protein